MHDSTKDGLGCILNRIQLSKNKQVRSVEEDEHCEMPTLFQNCLDSHVKKGEVDGVLDDLENYADMLENLSDIQETEDRLRRNVDELSYEDCGFLRSYSDFSFCTTAQVQNGNVNQM